MGVEPEAAQLAAGAHVDSSGDHLGNSHPSACTDHLDHNSSHCYKQDDSDPQGGFYDQEDEVCHLANSCNDQDGFSDYAVNKMQQAACGCRYGDRKPHRTEGRPCHQAPYGGG